MDYTEAKRIIKNHLEFNNSCLTARDVATVCAEIKRTDAESFMLPIAQLLEAGEIKEENGVLSLVRMREEDYVNPLDTTGRSMTDADFATHIIPQIAFHKKRGSEGYMIRCCGYKPNQVRARLMDMGFKRALDAGDQLMVKV
jgi:hypothetical protein